MSDPAPNGMDIWPATDNLSRNLLTSRQAWNSVLRDLGWQARVGRTTQYFVSGEAEPAG